MSLNYERRKETEEKAQEGLQALKDYHFQLAKEIEQYQQKINEFKERLVVAGFDEDEIPNYFEKPYSTHFMGNNVYEISIAKMFKDFQVGYLIRQDISHFYYRIDTSSIYLGYVPEEILDKFKFKKPLEGVHVIDGVVYTGEQFLQEVWERYKDHLQARKGDKIVIKRGHEKKLIIAMLKDGTLPFQPKSVISEDLRDYYFDEEGHLVIKKDNQHLMLTDLKDSTKPLILRDYQREGLEFFLKYGVIGYFWRMGCGKSYPTLAAMAMLKGKKVIMCKSKEQWREYIRNALPGKLANDIEVYSYHAANIKKLRDKKISLMIFDESHRLPATTYIPAATLNYDYAISLTGSPYREDGNIFAIFMLAHYVHTLDTRLMYERNLIKKPSAILYIARNIHVKKAKLDQLLKTSDKKTIVYVHYLRTGRALAKEYGVPFVSGETPEKERLHIIKDSQLVIATGGVASESISISKLERIIEYEFFFGSRREESQTLGRGHHSEEEDIEYIVIPTVGEYTEYGKRFDAIYEAGIKPEVIYC
ncbi:MAG: hypothetical protein E3J70_01595 [Candidatus Heimdallarchaeota archaeon]|nr:MAG: hypothetical protein E3J70_01595 [Candidatus Heimdallarchaeota archaeon]